MTIYIINGKKTVIETIHGVSECEAAAIGTAAVIASSDDSAYWTDRLPKGARAGRIERSTEFLHGESVHIAADRSAEVRCNGWLI